MNESCALDVADRGGISLEHAAELLNITRERVRQIEVMALARAMSLALESERLREYADGGPVERRSLPELRPVRDCGEQGGDTEELD